MSDRFWMHETGDLFVVASQNWSEMVAKMETFNVSDPMNIVKRGEETLIYNQEIKSAQYTGNRGYVVTFEQVDPLHVVDLSDPDNPTELGQLEVPGYSTYMQIVGDHIIAPGEDSSQSGTKVSMYSIADPTNPTEIDTIEIADEGGYASSEATYDWKAFRMYTDPGVDPDAQRSLFHQLAQHGPSADLHQLRPGPRIRKLRPAQAWVRRFPQCGPSRHPHRPVHCLAVRNGNPVDRLSRPGQHHK